MLQATLYQFALDSFFRHELIKQIPNSVICPSHITTLHCAPRAVERGTAGSISQQVKGQEEALGLRLIIGASAQAGPR